MGYSVDLKQIPIKLHYKANLGENDMQFNIDAAIVIDEY